MKSNIGHTKTTAGLSSLIKTAIALDQKILPATIGVKEPNEQFDTEGCPFYVNTDNRPWLADASRPNRCAGLSAFGFGGTNFHVVMQEYDGNYHAGHETDLMPRDAELFVWQASDRKSLVERLATFLQNLDGLPIDFAQLAYSVHSEMPASSGATQLRCAIVATSVDDLREKLKLVLAKANDAWNVELPGGAWLAESTPGNFADVCFLFPGQGSQSLDMLSELVLANRWSYAFIERADKLLAKQLPGRLSTSIYPLSKFGPTDRAELQARLNDTRVAQPALGLVDVIGCELLRSYNIQPAFAGGHSYGEYVALWAVGVLGTDELFKLSAERGRLAYEASRAGAGAMAAVFADAETTSRRLRELGIAAELANLNADDQTVISGPADTIHDAVNRLSATGIVVKKIPVTAAFHTSALDAAARELSKQLEAIEVLPPKFPVFSNTTARSYSADPAAIRQLLTEHLTKPVRFIEQINALHDAGARTFIEVGPGSVLTRLVGRILKKRAHTTIALDGGTGNAWAQLAKLLGQLFVAGKPVDVGRWFKQRGLRSIGVREYLDEVRSKQIRKPTDWIVSPSGARPAIPTALNSKKRPVRASTDRAAPKNGSDLAAPSIAATNGNGSAKSVVIPSPVSTTSSTSSTTNQLPRKDTMPDDSYENHSSNGNGHATSGPIGPARIAAPDTLAGFQQTMSQWLDLQKGQLWMTGRFLDLQENLIRASNGLEPLATAPSNGSPTNGAVIDARPVVHHPQPPVGLAVVPAPVLPPINVPTPTSVASPAAQLRSALNSGHEEVPLAPKATNGAVKPKAAVNGAPAAVHPEVKRPEATNGSEAPAVEQFRKDLLDAVSQRTGYPIDMLDENAALEAELGIDSIKTVEIFSSLTTYHTFLPGGDENQEETLATFSRMKTLRDIINIYEQRRSERETSNGIAVAEPLQSTNATSAARGETNGHHSVGTTSGAIHGRSSLGLGERQLDQKKNFPRHHLFLVLGEVPVLSNALEAALSSEGIHVRTLIPGRETKVLGNHRYEVDFSSAESLRELHNMLASADSNSKTCVGGVVNFLGLMEPANTSSNGSANGRHTDGARNQLPFWLFQTIKEFAGDLEESARSDGGVLVNFTSMGGGYAIQDAKRASAVQAALVGVCKAAGREMPRVAVKNIDLDMTQPPDTLFPHVLQEIASAGSVEEIGIYDGARVRVDVLESPLPQSTTSASTSMPTRLCWSLAALVG